MRSSGYVYIYIYICVCVCVCVCIEREGGQRERTGEKNRKRWQLAISQ